MKTNYSGVKFLITFFAFFILSSSACHKESEYDEIWIYNISSFSSEPNECFFLVDIKNKILFAYRLELWDNPNSVDGLRRIKKKYHLDNSLLDKVEKDVQKLFQKKFTPKTTLLSDEGHTSLLGLKNNHKLRYLDNSSRYTEGEIFEIINILKMVEYNNDALITENNKFSNSISGSHFVSLGCQKGVYTNVGQMFKLLYELDRAAISTHQFTPNQYLAYGLDSLQGRQTYSYAPTDGRYFAFPDERGDTVVYDIGFNAFETFLKDEYEKWLEESSEL